MAKNSEQPATVAALDPRTSLISALDATIQAAVLRNRELAAIRKQLDRETEANEEAIRIAEESISKAKESLQRSSELALTESL